MFALRAGILYILAAGPAAYAATVSVGPGDGHFRRLIASGGTVAGVDVSAAVVSNAGMAQTLSQVALAAANAVPASMANKPSGWAQLDTSAALSANVVAASKGAVARTLAAHFTDTVNAADYGMLCDGKTDDTAALQAAIAHAIARPGGAELDLPAGRCMLSTEIDVNTTTSLRIEGRGVQTTQLVWTGPTNGLVVNVSNSGGAAPGLTVADMQFTKQSGANGGSTVIHAGTALLVNTPNFFNAGQLVLINLVAQPPTERQQLDSWNQGFAIGPFAHADVINVQSFQGAYSNSDASSFPSVNQTATVAAPNAVPVATPSDAGWGVQCGFCIQGNVSASAFVADIHLVNVTSTGGLAGIDVGGQVQGVYLVNSTLAYGEYGIRWGDPVSNGAELAIIAGNHMNNGLGNIYLSGVHEATIQGNFFYSNDSAHTSHIWIRNGDLATVTGNAMTGGVNGIFLSYDSPGGFAGSPSVVSGNAIWGLSGIAIGNDKNTGALGVVGNEIVGAGTAISDGSEDGSGYMHNNYLGNTINGTASAEQGNDNSWWFPGSVKIGKAYSSGILHLEQSTGGGVTEVGTWDASSGNLTTSGTITVGSNGAHTSAAGVFAGFGGAGGGTVSLAPQGGNGFAPFSGTATLFGEVTCASSSLVASWRVIGHYTSTGGAATAKAFSATLESDADSAAAAKAGIAVGPLSSGVGVQVTFPTGTSPGASCTADLHQMVSG